MRFFVTLFSMYIIVLAVMPCTDDVTCEKEISAENSTHRHDHSEDHEDSCSPFCVCACCGVAGVLFASPKLFFVKTKKVQTPVLVSTYNSEFISSYYYTFWQPPKI